MVAMAFWGSPVYAQAPSTDLSALSVGGVSVAGFDAETTSYQ